MHLPKPRGSLSEQLFARLTQDATTAPETTSWVPPDHDDDAQIALWALYELHHGGFDDVDEELEWDVDLLALRRSLERPFEARLRERRAAYPHDLGAGPFAEELFGFVAAHDGASLASYLQREATEQQVRQLLRLRSLYHLREADPTTWTIPRLSTRVKAAVVELQYDEYGGGDPNRLHARLFARAMEACGLDARRFAYADEAPVEVLELNNAMSLFGLHRRLRAAALGHLAAFEATSSLPSRRMAQGLDRLGFPDELIGYYREHVEADAVHEQLAMRTICAALVAEEPALADDVALGAFTCLDLEDRFATWLLAEWAQS